METGFVDGWDFFFLFFLRFEKRGNGFDVVERGCLMIGCILTCLVFSI